MTDTPTDVKPKPKRSRPPAKPKNDTVDVHDTLLEQQETHMNTFDFRLHLIAAGVIVVFTLTAAGFISGTFELNETKEELEQVETKFNGYREGVRDVR
jgi:hypothetical protein